MVMTSGFGGVLILFHMKKMNESFLMKEKFILWLILCVDCRYEYYKNINDADTFIGMGAFSRKGGLV